MILSLIIYSLEILKNKNKEDIYNDKLEIKKLNFNLIYNTNNNYTTINKA